MATPTKRCWLVRVTWPDGCDCTVQTITVRPGKELADDPESICEFVKNRIPHRQGEQYFYPETAEIEYEVNPKELPAPFAKRQTPPQPLAAKPEPLSTE